MIHNEYQRFLQTLATPSTSVSLCKMANLIHKHLYALIPIGTHGGARVKKLVGIALQEYGATPGIIAPQVAAATSTSTTIKQLKSLRIGPFRGFAKQETFDLDSPLVLVYGPNGTGKSSFCEALEFGLLGTVQEAESKRISLERYLKNAHIGRFEPPKLEGVATTGATVAITAEESQFRFCFVEKNRIDQFSRIAAHTASRQTEIISSLFGLEGFNEFVRGFSTSIDAKYIDLEGIKAKDLAEKRKSLEGHKQVIANSDGESKQLETEEQVLANQYKQGISFAEFATVLPEEVKSLESETQATIPNQIGLNGADLTEARRHIETYYRTLSAQKQELASCQDKVSFQQLYEAVVALQVTSAEYCPACKTPLAMVMNNPYALASEGLKQLEQLSALQSKISLSKDQLKQAYKSAHDILKKACETAKDASLLLTEYIQSNDTNLSDEWWLSLINADAQGISPWTKLEERVGIIEVMDQKNAQAQLERQPKLNQLAELRKLAEQLIRLQTRRTTMQEAKATALRAIESFDIDNKALIDSVQTEKSVVTQNIEIAQAYADFVVRLNQYKEELPLKLVANLEAKVVELYNAFNRSDDPKDLLETIKLPVSSNEAIQIAFKNDPTKFFDALHILSEGHIRCIGLAILLAKNLSEKCPILIFDDPVNAIDDDHREAIRKTLFDDGLFLSTQIILTCHGEEFLKDIQNLLGPERTKAARKFTFLPRMGDKQIRIDFHSAPRNYILAAQEHLAKEEIRGALEKSRQALESLTKGKVWTYVSKYGDGNLSIKMRASNTPIELRNLTEQLKSKLVDKAFTHEKRDGVLAPMQKILGVGGESREWRYLNKGTHEEVDRAEFDRATVKDIVEALTELEGVLNSN